MNEASATTLWDIFEATFLLSFFNVSSLNSSSKLLTKRLPTGHINKGSLVEGCWREQSNVQQNRVKIKD
jgi:hypothetical protein